MDLSLMEKFNHVAFTYELRVKLLEIENAKQKSEIDRLKNISELVRPTKSNAETQTDTRTKPDSETRTEAKPDTKTRTEEKPDTETRIGTPTKSSSSPRRSPGQNPTNPPTGVQRARRMRPLKMDEVPPHSPFRFLEEPRSFSHTFPQGNKNKAPQFIHDFDKRPESGEKSPAFNYKNDVVRKKSERQKLKGFACPDCANYYRASCSTAEEMEQRIQETCRHRYKCKPPPPTPPRFWKIGVSLESDAPPSNPKKAKRNLFQL